LVEEDDRRDSRDRNRKHSSSSKRHHRHGDSENKRKKSNKQHRRHDDSDDSCDRRDRKEKKKKSKPYKKHRDYKDHKINKPDKSKLFEMGDPSGRKPDTEVDAEKDYFSYHQEFWIYLFREEGTAFNDLDSKHAKKAFARFAKRYNKGELEEPYYSRNFPAAVLEECKTTKHSWAFKTTERERQGLEALNEGIRRQTDYSKDDAINNSSAGLERRQLVAASSVRHDRDDNNQRRRKTSQELLEDRRANKRLKESAHTAQEEITGDAKDF
jgi:hypothetical protein